MTVLSAAGVATASCRKALVSRCAPARGPATATRVHAKATTLKATAVADAAPVMSRHLDTVRSRRRVSAGAVVASLGRSDTVRSDTGACLDSCLPVTRLPPLSVARRLGPAAGPSQWPRPPPE